MPRTRRRHHPRLARTAACCSLATVCAAVLGIVAAGLVRPPLRLERAAASTGAPAVPQGTLRAGRITLGGPRPQTLDLVVPGTGSGPVEVTVLRAGGSGARVRTIALPDVARGAPVPVTWDGTGDAGRPVLPGRYRFAVRAGGAAPVRVGPAFTYLRAFFPVRGPYGFGDGLGAGRGHQGVDVLSPCGTPLVAARGGTVLETGAGDARGHYVIVRTAAAGDDMAYFHLAEPPLVTVGQAVVTGQPLGVVGSTGRSTACHLHFERWGPPGYQRGRLRDPSDELQEWARQSGAGRMAGPLPPTHPAPSGSAQAPLSGG